MGWLHSHRLLLIIILVVALPAFAAGIRWGLPQAVNAETVQPWALDTIAPIAPLNEAYHRFTREGNEYVVYPLFHYVVLSAAYTPYVGWQILSGRFSDPSSDFPYGIDDVVSFCQDLTILARLVSLAMALGIVAISYRIALEIASRRVAVIAALATSLIAPLAYYAKTSNLDVPYTFWVCLAVWRFLRILEHHRLTDYLLLGLFTALAVATKDQAYGFFVLIPFVLAFARMQKGETGPRASARSFLRELVSPPMLAAGGAAILSYAAANNLFFGGLDGLIRHLSYGGEIYDYRQETDETFHGITPQFRLLARTGIVLSQMLGPLTLALALVGIVLVARDRNWKFLSLIAFSVSYYLTVIAAFNLVFSRYMLVTAVLLTPFAAATLVHIFDSGKRFRKAAIPLGLAALFSQAGLVVNLDLTLMADARDTMATWIYENVPKGSTIEAHVRERMLPHISADYRVAVTGNSENSITMAEVLDELTPTSLAARDPDYVLIVRDLGVTGDPAGWEQTELVSYYRKLIDGDLGYEIVASFDTPNFVPFRQIPGTGPNVILLERSEGLEP
jgi:hypothetical protein